MIDWLAGIKVAPFLLATGTGDKRPSVNVTRILEALVIAAVTAVATMYGTVQVLTVKFDRMEKDMGTLNSMAKQAIDTQNKIIPLRELQIKDLQDDVSDINARLKFIEKKMR